MLRTCARRGVVGGTALLVGLAGLTIDQGAAHASPPLSVDQAGPVAIWGPGAGTAFPVPSPSSDQKSEAFTKVVANGMASAIGLTAAGKVELIGNNPFVARASSDAIPAALADKKVVDIAGDSSYGNGIAVTDAGDVYAWNTGIEGWATTIPGGVSTDRRASQLQGSTAAAISGDGALAAVVTKDGGVRVWGNTAVSGDYGQMTPPAGLTGVTSVFFSGTAKDLYALKSDGTLVAWGADDAGQKTGLPTATTNASDDVDVKDVASVGGSAVALLSDGTLAAWGADTAATGVLTGTNEPPAETEGKDIVALAANSSVYFAVDSTGTVYEWGQGAADSSPAFQQLPAGVDPANITGLSANTYFATAIQATYGYLAKPTISGTAKVGQTLTATHATFTATPDEPPTGQWLANGKAIAGATGTTYKVTTAEVGKQITYSETAKRGTETAVAISDPTAKVAAVSTGGGHATSPIGGGHVTTPAVNQKLVHDQRKLHRDHAKLKKDKKKLKKAKKAHNAKKVKKLKKKIHQDKKKVHKDKRHVRADR